MTLIDALHDPSGWVRAAAAHALGTLQPPIFEAVPKLIPLLKDPDGWARECAVNALKFIEPQSPDAIAALIDAVSDSRIACDALAALGAIGDAAVIAVPVLIEALQTHPHPQCAASALGGIGPAAKTAVPALTGLLRATKLEARKGAAEALGCIGPAARGSVAALLQALNDHEFFAVTHAECECFEQTLKPEYQGLSPFLPGHLRLAIGVALWRIARHDAALPTLVAALRDNAKSVRWYAVRALKDLGMEAEAVASELALATSDPDKLVRTHALEALAAMGPAAFGALPVLIRALDDPEPSVRCRTAVALAELGPIAAPALDSLHRLLHPSAGNVRVYAAFAVWCIARQETGIDTLIEALDAECQDTCRTAAIKLGKIGPDARKAVPALMALSEESDGFLRRACVHALKRIVGSKDWN